MWTENNALSVLGINAEISFNRSPQADFVKLCLQKNVIIIIDTRKRVNELPGQNGPSPRALVTFGSESTV